MQEFGAIVEEFIHALSPDEVSKLFAAKDNNANAALLIALQNGNGVAVEAYCELLKDFSKVLSPKQLVELLNPVDTEGNSALFLELWNKNGTGIDAYWALLEHASEMLAPGQLAELITAKNADGNSALFMGLKNRKAGVVKAYGDLLKRVPQKWISSEQRVNLLLGRDTHGTVGLGKAFESGHVTVINAYIDICEEAAPALGREHRLALLEELRRSHASKTVGFWRNDPHYTRWKKENPKLYDRFKEMKTMLKEEYPVVGA